MAVQPQTPYKEYTANGSTKSFSLEFDCDNQDHLIVLVDDVEEIVGTWSLSNGAVVFGNAPTSGKKITIQRNTPFRRDGDFQSYDNSFRPGPVNKGFDWIWLKLQELGVADWILSTRINDLRAYVERQDSVLQENIDNLKTYVDDRDDELRDYLLEEIRKQGVALDQLDEYYNYLMQRLAQIAVSRGWDASFIADAGGSTQQDINDFGGAKWRNKAGGYALGATVKLDNGDIVKSTIDENTNDPNSDMTGWVKPNSASQILYANGYTVQASLYYLTPEMFGAVGDGITDDQAAIQSMLNAGAVGCVFEFDGSKTYNNAFNASGGYVNHYDADPLSKQWIRRGGCTFKFNGCKIKRKKPFGNINSGTSTYTDYDSSLILVWEAENVFIHGGTLDSGGELGVFVNLDSSPIESTRGKYCVADVQVHGLRLHKCKNVFLDNVHSHKAYFNIFIDQCENVYGTVQGNYAVQSPIKSSAPNDMNLGGSLKVWFSENIDLKMYGKYNANATAEIEKFNTNVRIVGSCDNDFSNGIVIVSTKHCHVDWTSRNVLSGSGAQIIAGGISDDDYCSHISGNITVQNTSWAGLLINVPDGTTTDWFGLNLNVVTSGCAYSGLIVENNSTKAILGSKIHHDSTDNGVRGSRTFKGNLPIYVSGSSFNNNFGLWMLGANTKTMCPTFNLDLRTCAAPYVFEVGSYAVFESLKLVDKVLCATNDVPLAFGQLNNAGSYDNIGTVIFYQNVSIDRAEYPILENVRSVHGENNKRVWYDATQATTVTGGKEYPLKLFIAD